MILFEDQGLLGSDRFRPKRAKSIFANKVIILVKESFTLGMTGERNEDQSEGGDTERRDLVMTDFKLNK